MNIFSPLLKMTLETNVHNTVEHLIKTFKLRVSKTSIKSKILEHPNYPSLLTVVDTLSYFGIKCTSFRSEWDSVKNLSTPFIVHIDESGQKFFAVVKKIEHDKLLISDTVSQKWHFIGIDEFLSKWTSIISILDVSDKAGDRDYKINHRAEAIQNLTFKLGIGLSCFVYIYVSWSLISNSGWSSWLGLSALFCKTFGTYIGILLLWYEIDSNNAILRKVCNAGKRVNCDAILQSGQSKLFGYFSWSEIGFSYFIGGMLFLIYNKVNTLSVSINYLFSLLVAPYVFFSIYYQWRIAKQWCMLCLTVQIILVTDVVLGLTGHIYKMDVFNHINYLEVLNAIAFFICPLIIWKVIQPVIVAAKESKRNKLNYIRLKNDLSIFETQLTRQKPVVRDSNSLGVILGNENSDLKLIKVCNPFCGPCANAHPEIHELLMNNPDLQVQIIYSVSPDPDDLKAKPVRHFLAIKDEHGIEVLENALTDWYSSENKKYDDFASKYPIHNTLEKYTENLNDMAVWCKDNNITYTPTFYYNGYRLPVMYDIGDLKHIIT